jgi:hypothetical protein
VKGRREWLCRRGLLFAFASLRCVRRLRILHGTPEAGIMSCSLRKGFAISVAFESFMLRTLSFSSRQGRVPAVASESDMPRQDGDANHE